MDVKQIIQNDADRQQVVQYAKETAQKLSDDKLKTTQVRNIFTEVRRIDALWERNPEQARQRLNMLRPKMAYQAARNKEVKYMTTELDKAIEAVVADPTKYDERFRRFMDLFEAVLAYHYALLKG